MHNYTSTTQGSGGSFTNRRYRRGWLLWVRDGRAKTLMDCQVVEVSSLSLSFLLFLWRSTYRPIYVSSYLSIYLSIYLIWSDLIWSDLIWSYLILSYLILSYLILSIYLSICLSFRPSRPNPNHWKTQCFTFRAPVSFFFWLFLFLSSTLLFSRTLRISAFHLCILSEVWLLNFLWWSCFSDSFGLIIWTNKSKLSSATMVGSRNSKAVHCTGLKPCFHLSAHRWPAEKNQWNRAWFGICVVWLWYSDHLWFFFLFDDVG